MRAVVVERVASAAQLREPAPEPDPADVITDDVVLIDPARRCTVGIHLTLPLQAAPWQWVRDRLEGIVWRDVSRSPRGGSRLSGVVAPSKTFGYLPPQVLRNRYGCSSSDLEREEPVLAHHMARLGDLAWEETARTMPGPAAVHATAVRAAIRPLWRINAGPWTSGIINRNNPLPYHRDSGNLHDCLSAMICLRRGVTGGHLHLPAYNVWLAIPDRSLTVFSGATLMHGVSPLHRDRRGRRFTFVFYARRGLTIGAPTPAEELHRARLASTSHDQPPA